VHRPRGLPGDFGRRPVAVLAALLTIGGGAAGCSGSTGTAALAAPSVAQAQALMTRHATAVLHHLPREFLADVDTGAAAARFRAAQAAMIENISDVPLASWSYTVAAAVTDPPAIAASAARYGRPTLLVRVTLTYALRGVDPRPAGHDLWLTFLRRGGQTYLAGDDDLVSDAGTSWRGIWDFGPVVVVRGKSSLVLGHIGDSGQLAALADSVDAAVPVVTGVWGRDWTRQVAVLVPATEDELGVLVGAGAALTDVSAVAVTDGSDPLSNRPSGQRLVMDPKALAKLTGVGRRIVVQHEITHLATESDTADTAPRWLVEGFADYVGNLGSGQSTRVTAAELAADIADGRVPAALPADGAFAPGAAGAAQAYEQAWLACRLIAERAGVAGLVRFYRQVGTATALPSVAVAAALSSVLHESLAAFTAQWRSYLTGQLG
jgi:hypothetical protein